MTAGEPREPAPDLYQLLGVLPGASRQEIALAWRRRAKDEHPDARPDDAGAPDRFRALEQAWHVLGDPARRAAYDHALTRRRHSRESPGSPIPRVSYSVRVPVRLLDEPQADVPPAWTAEPPLWAGPVLVEGPGPTSFPPSRAEDEIRLAILTQLAWRYLGRPW